MTNTGQREFSAEQVERLTKENTQLKVFNSLLKRRSGLSKDEISDIESEVKEMTE